MLKTYRKNTTKGHKRVNLDKKLPFVQELTCYLYSLNTQYVVTHEPMIVDGDTRTRSPDIMAIMQYGPLQHTTLSRES